jgi:hypothetical protein
MQINQHQSIHLSIAIVLSAIDIAEVGAIAAPQEISA